MSLAGLRKQLNKANQFVTEKLGATEGTKLDDEYIQIEKQVDSMTRLVDELIARTQEYLQPNPAYRAKLMTFNTLNKLQGKTKPISYPVPEGLLSECMIKYGKELENTVYGECLVEAGEHFKFMADARYQMEDSVKDNYLLPLTNIQTNDIKDINHHRKKLEGRRLDFDCKKRKQEKAVPGSAVLPQDEIRVAEEKFVESKVLAETSMVNFLNNDVQHIQALTDFVSSQLRFHRRATEIMEQLEQQLIDKKEQAEKNPKVSHQPQRPAVESNNCSDTAPGVTMESQDYTAGPCCRGIYSFNAENGNELAFKEGQIIKLLEQLDENWYRGELNGKQGYFPINYVNVINPLP